MNTMASVRPEVLAKAVKQARARGVILPTIAQQMNPALIPPAVVARLRGIGLWDANPLNLFRITWKNEPKEQGGGFNQGNWI